MATRPTAQHILASPVHFFNLVAQEEYDVFDLRSEEDYNAGHVTSASRPVDPVRDETLGERFDKVVVYGREDGASLLATEAFASFLSAYYCKRYPSSPPIYILEEPFEHFARDHPILIKPRPAAIPSSLTEYVLPSKVLPFLYLSGAVCSQDRRVLDILNIKFILNATTECNNMFAGQGIEYCRCSLIDDVRQDASAQFDVAIRFIDSARKANKAILVHCAYGVSRSATLVIAYVMHTNRWPYAKALQYVKQMREVVRPNRGFEAQLVVWGKSLGV